MNSPLLLLADRHLYLDEKVLPDGVRLERFDPSGGLPGDYARYDALLIRTVTRIDRNTLPGPAGKLKWIGSATAGHDHVDRSWLAELGIEFSWAAGCNAGAVAEYVATSVLLWSLRSGIPIGGIKAGIVGCGHSGMAAASTLERLGIRTVLYDPPRQQRDREFRSAKIEELLNCELLTFHTPLVEDGPHPTRHWLDGEKLRNREFRLILNAARGGVIDERALHNSFRQGRTEAYILDVWENEPCFDDDIAADALFATPHIAGYSRQAKRRATLQLLESVCRRFGLRSVRVADANLSSIPVKPSEPGDLAELLLQLHPVGEYDRRLRELIGKSDTEKAELFQRIRTEVPLRNEFPVLRIGNELLRRFSLLTALGFTSE